MTDGHRLALRILRYDPPIQSAHRRVEAHRRQRCHPQVTPHQVVAALAHYVAAWPAWLAVAVNATADLDRAHTEVGHEFARRGEALDVHDEGSKDGRGDGADAVHGVEVIGHGQAAIGSKPRAFQAS